MRRKPNNPRQISKKEYSRLQADLERFGDLGGIVHNVATDNVIGGNQRSSVFEVFGGAPEIAIVETYDPPTRTGTIARGYVIWRGEKYDYRRVAWDEATEDAACITANIRGGGWDWDVFSGWDTSLLKERGFDADMLRGWDDSAANLREMLAAENVEAREGFDFGNIPQEDRAPFRQMTFTLHDTQAEQVEAALKAAKAMGEFTDSPNENSNGNALARICETFLSEYGNG